MKQAGVRMAMLLAIVLTAWTARAQGEQASGPFRQARWDVDASWEVIALGEGHAFEGGEWGDDSIVGAHLGLGRYWTNHVKTELGVSLVPGSETLESVTPRTVTPQNEFGYVEKQQTLTLFTANATYQFFENVFSHPYVSAGLRIDALRESAFREVTFSGATRQFSEAAVDRKNTFVNVHPFAAVGGKFYFNERVYVRAELPVTFGPSGIDSGGFHFGFGLDF